MARTSAGRVSQKDFSRIPTAEIPRSVFNRSHGHKTTFDAGFLIPVFADEALPGDTFNLRMTHFVRLATPLFPVMDNVVIDFFFFAVPNRLLWDNWERFNGAQDDPGDTTAFTVPIFTAHTPVENSLSDYLGIPVGNSISHNAWWHRAYNFIWNEWFRDENLQDSLVVGTGNGPDVIANYVLKRRGKRHDYFTSCLPFAQKGTAVTLPLGASAPVVPVGSPPRPTFTDSVTTAPLSKIASTSVTHSPTGTGDLDWVVTALEADLSAATSATINDIRLAFQTQKLLERDARGGTRYTEIVRSHFGVTSPDARLQRPEYLGGGSSPMVVSPVETTARSSPGLSAGTLTGYGVSAGQNGFVKSFSEHCIIIGLANARADITYQQGLERQFSRQTRFEFYWPAFAHLGEQAVLNQEIFMDGSGNDVLTFGFQERYSEYRYKPSRVSGLFRSAATGSLDGWHLALDFSTLPLLNDVFIQDDPPMDRVIQVTTEPHFIGDFYFDFKTARPMPTFSVPGLIDHF